MDISSLAPLPAPFLSRIAPTPSGYLHQGNLLNFLIVDELARITGGKVRLRIDDIDSSRLRPAYLEDIFRVTEELGITIDLGPTDADDHMRNHTQSARAEKYADAIDTLQRKDLLFACSCSRKEILEASPSGDYPGTCANAGISLDTPDSAWRLKKSDTSITVNEWGRAPVRVEVDKVMPFPVIRKKDGNASYQIASVVDDLEHGVNFIVRGLDLLPSTAVQILLAKLIDRPEFADVQFLHHDLIRGADGNKLSKSNPVHSSTDSSDISSLREAAREVILAHGRRSDA